MRFVLILLLLAVGFCSSAQEKITTTTFKVFGACESCKERIELAAKGKGVISGVWDIDSQIFTLVYDAAKTSPEKVKKRIVAVGHDLEDRKAAYGVYRSLPECCLYRDLKPDVVHDSASHTIMEKLDSLNIAWDTAIKSSVGVIKGVVLEASKKGEFNPLSGASVVWLGTTVGTTTNASGVFSINTLPGIYRLVVSYSGYTSDTVAIGNTQELKIILGNNAKLKEVLITSKKRSTYLSAVDPFRTQIMTERELFKAACCNLSESFETNPSVDVSYNDAVTGAKQIQLLGLSGIYSQLTLENEPGPRGIAIQQGLNYIPGTWVESIQLNKGVGSVVNGFESIAGQINVELKKPESTEKLYANVYVNDFGKTDVNLNLSTRLGTKWSTALLLHDDFFSNNKIDFNKDGFRDLPTGNQISLLNRWKYDAGNGFMTQFGVRVFVNDKTGGAVDFDPAADKLTTNHYGLQINTERYEGFAKIGYVFPEKRYKSIGLQLSYTDHTQNSYYGLTVYDAKQQNRYANLIYQSIIGNTNHKFRTGLSYVYDKYDERFRGVDYLRNEAVPGAFFEYTFSYTDKLGVVAGLREDHNSLYGFYFTPRLHLRYTPFKGTTLRLSAGRGQRTANIFAENSSTFVSTREVEIVNAGRGKAYGLDPEVAWNKGISIDQKMKLFGHDAMISADYFRNDFDNQVVVDMEDPRKVKFYNLFGESYSNSFQTELNFAVMKDLDVRLAYRYYDVKSTYNGNLLATPLVANHRAFLNLAYSVNGWSFDYTLTYNGKKRIPNTTSNPVEYQRESYSPEYFLMNAQVTKKIGKRKPMEFYLGGENLGNYFQKNVIVASDAPFGAYFDASLIWGPVSGRMFYFGWRYKLK